MAEPGEQLTMESEAADIISGLLEKRGELIGKFLAALGPESVSQLSSLLSVPTEQESSEDGELDPDGGPDIMAAISEAITQEVDPMIDEVLAELQSELEEDETIDEALIEEVISQVISTYLAEVSTLLGL
jgi:hypothetical protein